MEMNNQDWNNLGNDIKNMVQSAIDSQNFQQLNDTVSATIRGAMDTINDTVHNTVNQATVKMNEAKKEPAQNPWQVKRPTSNNVLYKNTSGKSAVGYALGITGMILAGALGMGLIIMLTVGLLAGMSTGIRVTLGILTPLFLATTFMAVKGFGIIGQVKRFKTYVHELNGKTYCELTKLARSVGKSEKFILKDIQKMIRQRLFLEGHLDRDETCLLVSDEVYQEYQSLEQRREQLKLEEEQRRQEEAKRRAETGTLPEEVQKMVAEGKEYIKQIHKLNDDIPGEEISAKMEQTESIVSKIFQCVEKQPELAGDMEKFMEYYLPTTVKLLSAYRDLDNQPVQGENIRSSKAEIEKTLDTINKGFENLLDSFFRDTAWDISSDISVLHTMMARDGLTESGFQTK